MKKKLILSLLILSVASTANVFALSDEYTSNDGAIEISDASNTEESLDLEGLYPVNEKARGLSKPTQSAGTSWSFSGSAGNSTLYTDRYVTGKSSYTVQVNNKNNKALKVKIYKIGKINAVQTDTIPANGKTSFPISTKSEDQIYITFDAPSSFSGSIG